jgi:hypothetical protein
MPKANIGAVDLNGNSSGSEGKSNPKEKFIDTGSSNRGLPDHQNHVNISQLT